MGTGGLKMTVYCDYDSCEYYEDGCCYNDRIFLSETGECESYRQKIEGLYLNFEQDGETEC